MALSTRSTVDAGPGATLVARIGAALLCLGVVVIHVIDQGGIPGDKTPGYVGAGYYALEVAGLVAAVLLMRRATLRAGWLLAVGVALGPLVGYVLSRGPGLPGYRDDVGNWGEPLGVVSLVVEGVLLVLAAVCLARAAAPTRAAATHERRAGATTLSERGVNAG